MTTKRQRVLFIFPFPSLGGVGGVQRVFANLLRRLDRGRFELHLALLNAKEGEREEIPADVFVHNLDHSRVRYALLSLVRLIRRLKADVVFSNIGHINLALLLCRPFLPRNTRVFIGESTMLSVYVRQATRHPGFWLTLHRRLYKYADKIICLSEVMKREMAEEFSVPAEKLVLIYNPLDVALIQNRAELGGNPFTSDGPHLVAAARFFREKGIDLLLDAMPDVLAAYPQAKLTLLGEGPLEEELKRQTQRLNIHEAVTFAGLQQNPWRYFKHADLVIVPSRVDGLPYVPLEALAVGTAVVATDCPGGIREIKNDGSWIVLVPPEDPKALAEAIISRLREPKSNFGLPPQLSKFDLQQAIDQYAKLLDRDC